MDEIRFVEFDVDVSEAAGLDAKVHVHVTAALPRVSDLTAHPVVCFAQPGAGFSRRYFILDLPQSTAGGQAAWHARRGWIFVAIDPLGVGDSRAPKPLQLAFAPVCGASHAAAHAVLKALAEGTLADGFPPVRGCVVLGLGQSMGGALTVVQQAQHRTYDGVAVLGFSAVHTFSRRLPGSRPAPTPALARDAALTDADVSLESRQTKAANAATMELQARYAHYDNPETTPPGWLYFFDDVPRNVVDQHLSDELALWRSASMPGLAYCLTAPGVIAAEAASLVVPVLAAFGERDVVEDPRFEPKAYRHAVDVSLFICPRMGHMHNFAGTREILWSRIHHWGEHVAALKARLAENWPASLFSDSY